MTTVTILHEAEIELWQAVEFYESKCVGLGLDCETEIKAVVGLVQQSPDRWPMREDGTRRYLLRRFPYFIIYISQKGHVWVIAFAHCRRRPGYWSRRAGKAEPGRG